MPDEVIEIPDLSADDHDFEDEPEEAEVFEDEVESEEIEDEPEEDEPVADSPQEPVFSVENLKPHTQALFGVGAHVLVGAEAAGCLPSRRMTKAEAAAGIDQYLQMPVKGKEK